MAVNPPLVVAIGTTPTQLPNPSGGITVVNTSITLIQLSTDPNVQHNLMPLAPGSSLSLSPGDSYWATALQDTTLNVLTGNQTYFSTSSLQNQGIIGASGGIAQIQIGVSGPGTGNLGHYGAVFPNIQIWNFFITYPYQYGAADPTGFVQFITGQHTIDIVTPANPCSNRMAGLILPDGTISVINLTPVTIVAGVMVSPHS